MNANSESCAGKSRTERTRATLVSTPRCDIHEDEGSIQILAEMPGVRPEAIEVSLERHILSIVGRAEPRALEGFRRIYGEFEAGEYRRSFELSNDTDAAGIEAEMKNGVLSVRVPKVKPAQRKIPVLAR